MDAYGALLRRLAGSRTVLLTAETGDWAASAVGLATTAVATGRRTALIECDLAEPRLAERLGLATAPGVGEYLRGEAEAQAVLKPVVLVGPGSTGASEPLVCVVAGRPITDTWGLLASNGLQRMLTEIGAAYELVVIAGPSLRHPSSLSPLLAQVDSTVACVARLRARHKLSLPVTGLLIRD